MDNKEDILAALRQLKEELKAEYKVKEIGLFGSVVRGEQSETSDIDLLVDFEEGADLIDHMRLELFLEEKLRRKVDVLSRRALRVELQEAVLKETAAI
jgi:predicted nucleotidyltransferase